MPAVLTAVLPETTLPATSDIAVDEDPVARVVGHDVAQVLGQVEVAHHRLRAARFG